MMTFVDNINPDPVSSRNAADIVLTGVNSSKVNITVNKSDSEIYSFDAEPYQHSVKIRLTDILRSIKPLAFSAPPEDDSIKAAEYINITATADGDTEPAIWSRAVFHGGYEESLYSSLMGSYWWTWRDQRCRTFKVGKEYLGALFLDGNYNITVVAKFSDQTTAEQVIYEIHTPLQKTFGIVDVSYTRIADIFPDKTIVSYSVYRGDSSYPQVYEVSQLYPTRVFLFRNSLGLFDTVYATGQITEGAAGDVKTFIGEDRSEGIAANNSRERITVNSGIVDKSGDRTLWNEFIRSEDIWEYSDGKLRRIVVDQFDMKFTVRAAVSMTFEYHYSEEPAGYGYSKMEIV